MSPEPPRIWHPFTQHKTAGPPIAIERASGAYLYTPDGEAILDAIASWWINTHGHCHPKIARAVAAQTDTLEQVIFAGFTHAPARQLADKLLAWTADELEFVFFSDSGSTAVEVALKMAVGYWRNNGQDRHRIVALEHAYHGDTFGTMSVGERDVFVAAYEPMLFEVDYLPFPAAGREQATLDRFEALLKESASEIAALIVEPLVLGAGGMKMYSPAVLRELHALCRRHDVFFIADEVMTGFGRTGTRFACDQAGIVPDLVCLSKGLTAGYLPMGATLATRRIYDAFYSEDRSKMFFHSTSFTGNALACVAALANMEIWETEPVMDRIQAIADYHAARLPAMRETGAFADVRQTGTIATFEIKVPKSGYLSELGPRLYRFYLSKGVLLRPLGNVVYILPPYCVSTTDLDKVYDVIVESLDLIRH